MSFVLMRRGGHARICRPPPPGGSASASVIAAGVQFKAVSESHVGLVHALSCCHLLPLLLHVCPYALPGG